MITKLILDVGFENEHNQTCSKMRTFRGKDLEECLSRVREWFAQNCQELEAWKFKQCRYCKKRVIDWFRDQCPKYPGECLTEDEFKNTPNKDLSRQEGDNEFVGNSAGGMTWGLLFERKEVVVKQKREYAIAQVKKARLLEKAR